MATGEDQPQPIVRDLWDVDLDWLDERLFRIAPEPAQRGLVPCAAAKPIDRLVPGGLDEPRTRRLRHAGAAPLIDGNRKGFLRSLLRNVEIAEQPDERRDNPPPVRSVDRVNRRRHR